MGADLITYIVVGPPKLKVSKALRAKALKRMANVVSTAKQAFKDPDFDWQNDPLIGRLVSDGGELDELRWVTELDSALLLNDLLSLWNDGAARDANSRVVVINGKKVQVVVAGELSYGDEPQGDGYITLRDAERLGLFELLGLS